MQKKFSLALIMLSASILLVTNSCSKGDSGDTPNPDNATIPTLTTTAASNITSNSVQTGGVISSDGGASVTARGVCYGYLPSPTVTGNSKTIDGTGTGTFISNLSSLVTNHNHYIRAYATNSKGTAYGNEIFITTAATPSITTQSVSVQNNKWLSGGNNINSSASPVTAKGICWSTTPNPTIANDKTNEGGGANSFTSRAFLSTNSTYYVRAYATNSFGTGYGNQVTVTTGIAIGLLHAGGMIYNLDGTGIHGFVAALSDQGATIPWAPGNLFTTSTNTTSFANGAANTTQIINVYGNTGSYAAKLCRDYRGGGFADWFLPARDQLLDLSAYKDVVPNFPTPIFLGNFYYWSSTESNNFLAVNQDFNYVLNINNMQKDQTIAVRAIRAF